MKTKIQTGRILFFILLCFLSFAFACKSDVSINKNEINLPVCAVLAHPDDETIISGTLAKLVSKGCTITVVYVTSGDGGIDGTGRGLHGDALAEERENEARRALQAVGIRQPPIFLEYRDGHVPEHTKEIQDDLQRLFNEIQPEVVVSFGPDGITGDWDHKMTGFATDSAFDMTEPGKLLLHMAITNTYVPMYANGVDVPGKSVNMRVKVSDFKDERIQVVEAHKTQFSGGARLMYKAFVNVMRSEAFIIARNREANALLQKCFDIKDH